MTTRYFVSGSRMQFNNYVRKLNLDHSKCVYINDAKQLRGLRDIKLEVLPGAMESDNFQGIFRVALERNIKMESLNVK